MSQGNYSEEIKEHILSEHEAGVSVRELARRYEPSATTIQNWKRQAKAKASESEPGESEVAQLRRTASQSELEQENAFLKKAALVCRRQRDPAWWNRACNRSGEEELYDPFDVSGIRDFRLAKP